MSSMKRSSLVGLTAVLGAAWMMGCASSRQGGPHLPPPDPAAAAQIAAVSAAQTLGSGDVFSVRVVGEEELSGDYRVASDGTISFPFCGKLGVDGETATQISGKLTACLADGYLKNPQVTVFLKEHNSKKIFVFGEVNKPGTFVFEDRMNVVQAITLAGGFTKLAARNSVLVTRSVDGKEQRFRVAVDDIGTGKQANLLLHPGDIIYVSESFF